MSAVEIAVIVCVVTMAACVQGAIGFGMALIASPLLVLIEPRLIPGPLMASGLVMAIGMALRDREHADLRNVRWSILGYAIGAPLGAAVLVTLDPSVFAIVFGVLVLLAVRDKRCDRPGVAEDVGDLARWERGIDRDVGAARRQGGEVRQGPFGSVVREDGDLVAGLYPELEQPECSMFHAARKLLMRNVVPDSVGLVPQGGPLGAEALDGVEIQVVEGLRGIHRMPPTRGLPSCSRTRRRNARGFQVRYRRPR